MLSVFASFSVLPLKIDSLVPFCHHKSKTVSCNTIDDKQNKNIDPNALSLCEVENLVFVSHCLHYKSGNKRDKKSDKKVHFFFQG